MYGLHGKLVGIGNGTTGMSPTDFITYLNQQTPSASAPPVSTAAPTLGGPIDAYVLGMSTAQMNAFIVCVNAEIASRGPAPQGKRFVATPATMQACRNQVLGTRSNVGVTASAPSSGLTPLEWGAIAFGAVAVLGIGFVLLKK